MGAGAKRRDREARRRIREKAARESNDSASVTYLRHAGGTRAFTRVNRLVYLFLGRSPSSFFPATNTKRKGYKQRYVTQAQRARNCGRR